MRTVTAPVRPSPVSPPQPEPEAVEPSAPTDLEYRVVKSRRAGGSPYLLQRGHWEQQKGKRVFNVDWEKGFEDREKAEAHVAWVQRSVEELASVSELVDG